MERCSLKKRPGTTTNSPGKHLQIIKIFDNPVKIIYYTDSGIPFDTP